jgi:hypothetical protein
MLPFFANRRSAGPAGSWQGNRIYEQAVVKPQAEGSRRVRSGKIVKMGLQISMFEMAANLENLCFGLKASVRSAKSSTTFVGGALSGKIPAG